MHHLVSDVIDVGCSFDFHLEAPMMELSSTTTEETGKTKWTHRIECHVMSCHDKGLIRCGTACYTRWHVVIFCQKMACGMLWHGTTWHVTYYVTLLYGIKWYGMPWHRMHMKYFGHGIALPHMSRYRMACDKLFYWVAWHCLHWCHQGLFIDRPVVVIGHVIHSLCNAEEHHSGAVSLRDRFTKVILKNIIENMNVTRNCVLERNVE